MSAPELEKVASFLERVRPFVLSQYINSPRIMGTLAASCAQEDHAEADGFAIRAGFVLADAVGVQLDTIGAMYKELRNGRTDDTYRLIIQMKAATAINGNPEEILGFLRNILGITGSKYIPSYPAGFKIAIGGFSSTSLDMGELVKTLAPAGVDASLATGFVAEDSPFDLLLSEVGEWFMLE